MLSGCATSLPSYNGGSITPHERTDTLIGTSAKITALHSFSDSSRGQNNTRPNLNHFEGISPNARASYGLSKDTDLGMLVSGSTFQLHWRKEWLQKNKPTRPAWILGIKPFIGWNQPELLTDSSHDYSISTGLEIPLLYALEVSGVFELWAGVKFGFQYNHTWLNQSTLEKPIMLTDEEPNHQVDTWIIRPGGVLGIATGFRRVHVLLEVTSYYENWHIHQGTNKKTEHAWTFVPAVGLRIRI